MSDDLLYPHETYQQWQSVLDRSDLTSYDIQNIMLVVQYVQPPLSIETLTTAAEIFSWDHHEQSFNEAISQLSSHEIIKKGRPSNIGTLCPVFFAMTNPRFLGISGCQKSFLGRQLIHEWFSTIAAEINTSRHNFYSHVLAVRHVLMAVIGSEYQADDTGLLPDEFFLSAIKSDSLYSERRSIERSYKIFAEINKNDLSPGELIRRSSGGRRGAAQKKREKKDPWHDAQVQALAKLAPPARTREAQPSDPKASGKPGKLEESSEAAKLGFRPISTSTVAVGDAEKNEQPVLQRQTPSALTPTDDKRVVQQWAASTATTSLSSVGDLSRLPPEHVREVLTVSLTPIEKALAVLLIITGIPVNRLTSLEVQRSENAAPPGLQTKNNDRPVFFSATAELWYRLLDGPSAPTENKHHQWVQLRVPDILAAALLDPDLLEPDRPFRRVRTRLNRRLQSHFRKHPGIMPTANRLRASSWLWRRPHACDDVAAEMLTGQFGLALAAPAAYRQVSRAEIQCVFNNTVMSLGINTESTLNSFEHPADNENDSAMMGSAIAQPPDVFALLFGELRDAMTPLIDELAMWWAGQPFPRQSFAALYQYVAAYNLLAWQLSTGARPVGPSTQVHLGSRVQWIRDKGSSRDIESRVIPLLTDIQKSLSQLQRWTGNLLHQLRNQNIIIDDRRTNGRNTPAWLLAPARGRRLVLRDMTWADLRSLSLTNTVGLADNVARHSLTSWLRERVTDAAVDALLGHALNGRSLSSPRAAATINQDGELRRQLNAWLRQCGYKQLKWENFPWQS